MDVSGRNLSCLSLERISDAWHVRAQWYCPRGTVLRTGLHHTSFQPCCGGQAIAELGREGLLGVAWQVDAAREAAIAAGLTPLAVQQPAHAYDSAGLWRC